MKRLGIDFGSSYIKCCDADKGKLIALDKAQGGESLTRIPSVITYYKDGKVKLGKISYKARSTEDIENAVIVDSIKTKLSDPHWQAIVDDKPISAFNVTCDIMKSLYDIIHIKNANENEYRVTVTVPVCFSERQRKMISSAAEKAGFTVESIISEPFASLFYLMKDELENDHNVLIIDIGGGTLDVCLVSVKANEGGCEITTESTAGIRYGGIDLNNDIIEDLLKKYSDKLDPILNDKDDPLFSLRKRSELFSDIDDVKSDLFSEDFDEDSIDEERELFCASKTDNIDLQISAADIYRLLNERKIDKRLYDLLDKVIDDSSIFCEDITDVFLTGGSSMIPYFKNIVTDFFKDHGVTDTEPLFELYNDLEFEEQAVGSVAMGAGIYNKLISEENEELFIKDKIPFTVFTKDLEGKPVTKLMADCVYKSYRSPEYPLDSIKFDSIEVFQKMPDDSDEIVSLGSIPLDDDIRKNCSLYRLGIDPDRRVFIEFGVINGNKNDAVFSAVGDRKYLEIDV